ncbi:hypothetical protein ESY86_05065 [Subsaximicrobium wynnwilliamsii]|uniref:Uncharacterized protein n=2 Tax=Subsaximicrobium wynnwilliamsii TaxID=291179 RepID=A0A5C6ZKE4_9FLAO|nr:hypothetical protein ESY87_04845 [Subsaximicrobium wynnwilliamsii]TXD90309.1 hypothetical protein ESY86_05065 [Subsaximicrobium wynnwilliamsii]TXE04360.1 hypothetical protein ESY88_04840 [Subsaximicrobium wynnwilliamsii]
MSKWVAISYSLLILAQSVNINFEDISKFKVLLKHANYHAEAYGHSFVDFMAAHYGEARYQHANTHEDHKDLPFKDNQQLLTQFNTSFTLNTIDYVIHQSYFVKIPFNFFYKDTHSLFEKPSVFQPPKLI